VGAATPTALAVRRRVHDQSPACNWAGPALLLLLLLLLLLRG
jgi:hypothetical protein